MSWRVAPAAAERAHPQPQPARRPALHAGDAHFFLQARAFARRLEQAVDRLGSVGIADEHALDRPHVVGVGRVDEIEIGGIGVDDAAGIVGDENAVEGARRSRALINGLAGSRPESRRMPLANANSANTPMVASTARKPEDVRLGIVAAEQDDGGRRRDQHGRHQQHQNDAAGARRAGTGAAVDRLANRVAEVLAAEVRAA